MARVGDSSRLRAEMIPLATIAATLALVTGHPTSYDCATQPLGVLGFTDAATWTIGFSPWLCNTWDDLRHPYDLARQGEFELAVVHEAEHVRYRDGNEAATECRTTRDLPAVLARAVQLGSDELGRYEGPRVRDALLDAALAYDATLPASYHGGC